MKEIAKKIRIVALSVLALVPTSCAPLAALTVATSAAVSSDERTVGAQIDDKVVANKIRIEYVKAGADYVNNIAVTVIEGRVLLIGYLANEKMIEKAEKIAWTIKGVKEVINELHINPGREVNRSDDLWIAGQIKTKYVFEKHFSSMNFKVEVYDKVVYLFGIAKSQEELDKAIAVASAINGVQKVVNHTILKSDPRRSS